MKKYFLKSSIFLYMILFSFTPLYTASPITTNTDFHDNLLFTPTSSSELPLFAQIGVPLTIQLNSPTSSTCKLYISGLLSNHIETLTPTTSNNNTTYTWIPDKHSLKSGIYTLKLFDASTHTLLLNRKLYLSGEDDSYSYQISNLVTTILSHTPMFSFNLLNTYAGPISSDSSVDTNATITIGEPGLWQKTIKNITTTSSLITVTDGEDFRLNNGNYLVTASVKNPNSIEYEDSKTTVYNNPYIKDSKEHPITLSITETTPKDSDIRQFEINATCQYGCDLLVDLYLYDDLGLKSLGNNYDSHFTFKRDKQPFDYEIIARARHKESMYEEIDSKLLPPSYEVQKSLEILKDSGEEITINSISITPSSLKNLTTYTPEFVPLNATGNVLVNNKNYITVNTTYSGASTLYYKAWAIDDGYVIPLGDYSTNPNFIYYPKSGGHITTLTADTTEKHQLYISVEAKNNQDEVLAKATGYITLNISNQTTND